jgi:hypothetical protein
VLEGELTFQLGEELFTRRAGERVGVEPPEWARQPIPEVVRVGPRSSAARDLIAREHARAIPELSQRGLLPCLVRCR